MSAIFGRLCVFLLLACSIAEVGSAEPGRDLDRIIEEIEREVVMPPSAQPLEKYNRFYGFYSIGELKVVKGVYLFHGISVAKHYRSDPSTTRDAYRISGGNFPGVADGGCRVVTVIFNIEAGGLVPLQLAGREDSEPQLGMCNGR